MPGSKNWKPRSARAATAAALALVLVAGGCSSLSSSSGPGAGAADRPGGYAGSGSITDLFAGSSAKGPQTVAGAQPDINCPPVDVRQGASTLTIGPTGNKTAMTLKYQGMFTREARDCAVVDGNMVVRIGVQGRVVVGPAGGPGQLDVPLRIAVVQETPGGSKFVATKFVRIPVTVANNSDAIFSHVEEGITFPVPTPASQLDDYVIYIGFDPLTAEAQDKQKQEAPPPKRRGKPSASAN